jgi:diamine N-acetyltransferase
MYNASQTPQVSLRRVTSKTVRTICELTVSDNQRGLVTANAISIAEASFYKNAWFRAIYADDAPVGFIMLHEVPKYGKYYLWRFMIDSKYQRLGYGRKALEMVILRIKDNPKANAITLSLVRREGSAESFYRKFGFEFTGEIDSGQHIMKLSLKKYFDMKKREDSKSL